MILQQKFKTLSTQEKINFFIHCQEILITYHPKSPFIFNRNNYKERLSYVSDMFNKYNGHAYQDEHICVLFNYIHIKDPDNPIESLIEHSYQEPKINYNAISIDWACFRSYKDCLNFIKLTYNSNIEYILWVKDNKPKIHKTIDYISKLLKIPII